MRARLRKGFLALNISRLALISFMLLTGVFTCYASANTYEVITRQDIPYSSVITNLTLTANPNYNQQLYQQYASQSHFNIGSFGIPQKIKFPEATKHIDIVPADNEKRSWKASQGLAQTFLTAEPRQKVFGGAVIYMRINTPTTQFLGSIYAGDTVNIVTTEGWQLGYQVTDTASDPSALVGQDTASTVTVIMVDEHTHAISSFRATLSKVGERI